MDHIQSIDRIKRLRKKEISLSLSLSCDIVLCPPPRLGQELTPSPLLGLELVDCRLTSQPLQSHEPIPSLIVTQVYNIEYGIQYMLLYVVFILFLWRTQNNTPALLLSSIILHLPYTNCWALEHIS